MLCCANATFSVTGPLLFAGFGYKRPVKCSSCWEYVWKQTKDEGSWIIRGLIVKNRHLLYECWYVANLKATSQTLIFWKFNSKFISELRISWFGHFNSICYNLFLLINIEFPFQFWNFFEEDYEKYSYFGKGCSCLRKNFFLKHFLLCQATHNLWQLNKDSTSSEQGLWWESSSS
jgi:hypothetical protein